MIEELEFEIDPEDYFNNLKSKVQETDSEFLKNLFENSMALLKKAHAFGQTSMIKKLLFTIDVLEKESYLLQQGIKTFIYRDDIEYYMDKVSKQTVKIINLAEYPREIPDEVAEVLIDLKEKKIFDEYYIVFTDYTGAVEREVAEKDKKKDPILFGAFTREDRLGRLIHDRFYYIADWEDEYCDLTLSKMISEMSKAGKVLDNPVCIPDSSLQSIRDYLTNLEESGKIRQVKKKSFFSLPNFFSKRK